MPASHRGRGARDQPISIAEQSDVPDHKQSERADGSVRTITFYELIQPARSCWRTRSERFEAGQPVTGAAFSFKKTLDRKAEGSCFRMAVPTIKSGFYAFITNRLDNYLDGIVN